MKSCSISVGVLLLVWPLAGGVAWVHGQELSGSDKKLEPASQEVGIADHALFMCIFAYDTNPRRAQTAHTFATFVKRDGAKTEIHTISWLPQTEQVRVLRRFSETGMNLSLAQTLELARATQAQVHEWGPYQIRPELYENAMKQIQALNSGTVTYKAIDRSFRPDGASNCIHAVSDIDASQGTLMTGTHFGAEASALVANHLSRWIVNPQQKHPEINAKLNLAAYSVISLDR